MASYFKAVRRVEFSETDMAGIVHFSNFFRYMETVEHGFYRSLGFSVILSGFNRPIGLPRVHASFDFKRPLRFEDSFLIELFVLEKKEKTLTYRIRISRSNAMNEPIEECALGKLIVVCVERQSDGSFKSIPIPKEIQSKIEVFETL